MSTQMQTRNGKPQQTNGSQAIAPVQSQAVAAPVVDNSIRGLLERSKAKFAEVLPKHLNADRLVRVTVACIARTPALGKCSQVSLLNAVMQSAQLGLEPTGVLGGAYLVPYKDQCTLIIGYRGLIDLARRSGQIESIEAHVVHANDRFRCRYGLDPVLEHEPAWEGEPGPLKAVYAVAKLKDGGRQIEVMTRAQVDAIRNRSKSGSSGPWVTDYDEMARKTVVRRIAKYLPLTPELADALQVDQDNDPITLDATTVIPKGVAGLKALAAHARSDASGAEEPPHDEQTGEIREPGADDGDDASLAAEAAERERQELAAEQR